MSGKKWAELGSICRRARLESKTTQEEFAKKYGHTQQAISRFERGMQSFVIFDYMREYPHIVNTVLGVLKNDK